MEGLTSPPVAQSNSVGKLTPLLISMLGIVLTTTSIIIYHYILVKYCMRQHHDDAAATTTAAAVALEPTGVDAKILQKIPISTFSAVKRLRFHADDQEECVVCLGELEDEDMVRFLPDCGHAFHVACVDRWFLAHASCPLCRSPITAEPPKTTPCRSSTNNNSDLENANGTTISISNSSGDDQSQTQSPPRAQSSGQFRRSVSLALPPAARLKRSVSVDQSFVAINLQTSNNCSTSSTARGELTRSLSNFDRVSSKLRNSFSLLRLGKGSDAPVLPY